MAWELLPTDYVDAVWQGLKRYTQVDNEDGTVSFQDVTQYTQREKSFFGAHEANRMDEALNILMSMVEGGTDIYEDFLLYFDTQKEEFEEEAVKKQAEFENFTKKLEDGYADHISQFMNTQESIFNVWFDTVKGQLSTDVAGDLQNQIDDIEERQSRLEAMWLTNDFVVPLADDDTDIPTLITDDYGNSLQAEWAYDFKE